MKGSLKSLISPRENAALRGVNQVGGGEFRVRNKPVTVLHLRRPVRRRA
jgi:hypothetical protein